MHQLRFSYLKDEHRFVTTQRDLSFLKDRREIVEGMLVKLDVLLESVTTQPSAQNFFMFESIKYDKIAI